MKGNALFGGLLAWILIILATPTLLVECATIGSESGMAVLVSAVLPIILVLFDIGIGVVLVVNLLRG